MPAIGTIKKQGYAPRGLVRHAPVPPKLPTAAWINPPKLLAASTAAEDIAQ